jgi:cardiolipin synthase
LLEQTPRSAATSDGSSRRFWTGPNLLTLSRIPLAALVWLYPTSWGFVLGLMLLAGTTDVLDGWWERRLRATRPGREAPGIGVWLDPLCDKIFVVSLLAALAVAFRLPAYLLPLIAAREILQTLAAVGSKILPALRGRLRFEFRAAIVGKAATASQFLSIGAILAKSPWTLTFSVMTGVLGLVAAAYYVGRAWQVGSRIAKPSTPERRTS